jgi:hypothetical protein
VKRAVGRGPGRLDTGPLLIAFSGSSTPLLLGREVQLTRDLYGGLDGHRHRTAILVHFDHALYGLAILLLRSEMEGLLDPLKYENLLLCFYLTDCIGVETVLLEGNLTRCQRASKGTEQSATSRCNQVIEGGGVRFHFLRGGSVVFGDFAMSTEQHEVLLRREMRPPNHAPNWIHPNP